MGEALFYLLELGLLAERCPTSIEHKIQFFNIWDTIVFHPAASYVVGLCNNKFAIREHIVLARFVTHLWQFVNRIFS